MSYTYSKECRFQVYILESFVKYIHPNQNTELFHHPLPNFPLIKKKKSTYNLHETKLQILSTQFLKAMVLTLYFWFTKLKHFYLYAFLQGNMHFPLLRCSFLLTSTHFSSFNFNSIPFLMPFSHPKPHR